MKQNLKKRTINLLFMLAIIMSVVTLNVFTASASFEYSDGEFTYLLQNDHAEVTGYIGSSSTVNIPSSINYRGQTVPVTAIGKYSFEDKTKIKTLTIPKSIESIGNCAFKNCTGLTKINYNAKSVKDLPIDSTYSYCYNYSVFYNAGSESEGIDVIFGSTVSKIPAYLFATGSDYDYGNGEYARINSVTIPNSVTEIGGFSFYNCYELKTVKWGTGFKSVGKSAFENCYALTSITIPSVTSSIGNCAFKNCTELTKINYNAKSVGNMPIDSSYSYSYNYSVFYNAGSKGKGIAVTFGSTVSKIPAYLFATGSDYDYGNGEYARINSVAIPNSVTEIGEFSFYNCYELKTVKWGTGFKSVGKSAFENCYGLTSITIPSVTSSIGNCAFKNCTGLTKINYNAKSVENMPIDSSYSYSYNYSVFYNAGSKGNGIVVTFGSTVSKIPAYLFATGSDYDYGNGEYARIKSIVIPSSVKEIGAAAFYNCYDLKTASISTGKVSVGDDSFANCNKLTIKCYYQTDIYNYALKNKIKVTCFNPGTPSSLKATSGSTSVKLTWNKATGATGYRVFQYDAKTKKWVKVSDTSKTNYTVSKLKSNTSYKFAVRAYVKAGSSLYWSSSYPQVTVRTLLANVTNLKATQSTSAVKLTWSKVAGATGYRVYRHDGKKWVKLTDTKNTTYTISKLKAGTNYKYAVKAYTTVGKTVYWSDSFTQLSTATKPATPAIKVTAGKKQATVSWNKITGATGYVVYYSTSKNGTYKKLATVKGTSYTAKKLTTGKTYYFKVAAYKTVGKANLYGSYSSVKGVKVK